MKTIEQTAEDLISRPDALASVVAGHSQLPILTFLEHPYNFVQEGLVNRLMASGISADDASKISLRSLILYALTTQDIGSHWGSCAVTWLESGFPIDSGVASALEVVAQDKRFHQHVRHQAFSISNMWRKSHPGVGD